MDVAGQFFKGKLALTVENFPVKFNYIFLVSN
jgi:hypothetical protein